MTPPVRRYGLAAAAWGQPAEKVRLDLRYADDEAPLLDPAPADVWAATVAVAGGYPTVGHYPVDDPYGGARGAPVVAQHFGCPLAPDQVSFGAGITALLRDLSGLADAGPIVAPGLVHPDLEVWAARRGAQIHLLAEPVTGKALVDAIGALRPGVVHLDRPSFTAQVPGFDEVTAVARAAAAVGAVLVVDEAAAPYLRPTGSAVRLVGELDNLVVLRGFTKAYSMGGLRCGYAVASTAVAERVRDLVVPMQVGELSLAGALRLLAAGDCFGPLRARIREVKPAFAARLAELGYQVTSGHADIPWVVVADPGGSTADRLAACGIRGLAPVPAPSEAPVASAPLHLTVPLSPRRIALFESLLRAEVPT